MYKNLKRINNPEFEKTIKITLNELGAEHQTAHGGLPCPISLRFSKYFSGKFALF